MEGEQRRGRRRERERGETEREKGESERGEGAIKSEGERLLRIPRQCHYDRRACGRAGASFVRKLARTKIAFRRATGDIHQNCYDQ